MTCLLRNKTSEKSCFLGFLDLFITCYIVNLRQFFFFFFDETTYCSVTIQ